eukprot:TRINITY_DN6424_c0_g1_i2.p2 TRINITY_DN6424_c0_g1~~TRINITY_DN6424_c0_g1_i2.p2  ORF type:complete len:139 (-),score=3.51 TRINITY_DN6424_c0_g1_i2:326-742(-)
MEKNVKLFSQPTVFDSVTNELALDRSSMLQISKQIVGIRSDEQLKQFMSQNKEEVHIIQWGASWCLHCKEIFPVFKLLSDKFQENKYGLAQIDYMEQASRQIKYTPTFSIFKNHKVVDEFCGVDAQKLRDHIWLHNDK